MAIGHLPRTTVCLLPHSHLVRETDHLFLLRAENFPDISRELPCTSHWLKLDHEPIPEQISSDRKILCADWLRPRSLNQSLASGWCYYEWLILIRANHWSWFTQPSPRHMDTWEVVCLGRNRRKWMLIGYQVSTAVNNLGGILRFL